jgi:type VI secretion system protein ImpK
MAAACLLLVFLGLSWTLNRSSDAVYAGLHDIPDRFAPAAQKPAAAPLPTRLSSLLQPEIAAGWVSVTELADRAIVRIRGDNLVESGSATVNAQYHPVLTRIAEALNSTTGPITVTGHTDDKRIFSARFPSNWALSRRADAKSPAVLAPALAGANRLHAEGRADRNRSFRMTLPSTAP